MLLIFIKLRKFVNLSSLIIILLFNFVLVERGRVNGRKAFSPDGAFQSKMFRSFVPCFLRLTIYISCKLLLLVLLWILPKLFSKFFHLQFSIFCYHYFLMIHRNFAILDNLIGEFLLCFGNFHSGL